MTILHDASSGNGIGQEFPLPAKITESTIMQPVDLQGRYQQTIQTHNAVSVGASGTSTQTSWIDTNGFDKVAVTLLNDAGTSNKLDVIWSNDGVGLHGVDWGLLSSSTGKERASITDIKARYLKIRIYNDATDIAHIMSAWVYLKC